MTLESPGAAGTRRHLLQRGLALVVVAAAPAVATVLARPAGGSGSPPPEVASELPGAVLRGAGVLRYFGLHIYDARLWSPAPLSGDGANQPLALELTYARRFAGEQIASRSIDEMRRIGPVSDAQATQWRAALSTLLPDVQAHDRLTGVQRPGHSVRFFYNGKARGELADAAFARLFFGIWLSPNTSEPRLRAQLLAGAA